MPAAALLIATSPPLPAVLGRRGAVCSFVSHTAWAAWARGRRQLLAAVRRARQRQRPRRS